MRTLKRTVVLLLALTLAPQGFAQEGMREAGQGPAVGEAVLLQGQVLDTEGNAIVGARIELWQADRNGNYDHPRDAPRSRLLSDFQYFGVATSDEEGYYAFLTVKPSAYARRPPHFHFKVKIDGRSVLTSQFYFPADRQVVEDDAVYGGAGATLFLATRPAGTLPGGLAGRTRWIAEGHIILDLAGSGAERLTPTARQAEGPYYPAVDFTRYDSDLTRATTDDPPIRPVR